MHDNVLMWAGEVMQRSGVFCGQGEGKMGSRIHRKALADARSTSPPYPLDRRTAIVPSDPKGLRRTSPPSFLGGGVPDCESMLVRLPL